MKLYLVFVLLLISNFLFSQNPKVIWGNNQKKPGQSYILNFSGATEQSVYLVRYHRGGLFSSEQYYLEKYDQQTLNFVGRQPFLPPPIKGKATNYNDVYILGGKPVLFFSQLDKSRNKYVAYAQFMDNPANREIIELATIDSIPRKSRYGFEFVLNRATQQVLISQYIKDNVGNTHKVFYKIIDKNLNTLATSTIQLPVNNENAEITKYVFDNKGNLHLLCKHWNNVAFSLFNNTSVYNYSIFSVNTAQGTLKEFELNLGSKSVSDVSIKLNGNDDLLAAGFFSKKTGTYDQVGGVFYLLINSADLTVKSKALQDFDIEFLKHFMSDRRAEKGKELDSFSLENIFTVSDGGAVIIAEQYYVKQVCNTDFRTGIMYCNDYYNYNDIIAVKINGTGNIDWNIKIPKRQTSINDGGPYSSFCTLLTDNLIYVFYNENPRNINNYFDTYSTNPKRAVAVSVSINPEGKTQKNVIDGDASKKLTLKPKLSFQLNNNDLVVYAERNNLYKLGKIVAQ